MQNRMPTRRCSKAKVPCQQIPNIFSCKDSKYRKLVPENIFKILPSTQKISCQSIQKVIKFLPNLSDFDALQQIRNNSKIQFEQIIELVRQPGQPNNVSDIDFENRSLQFEKELKRCQTPIRKMLKKDDCTHSISDFENEAHKQEDIFIDSRVIHKLEDYLSIQ